LADRSLSVHHVRHNTARPKHSNQIALPKTPLLHQNAKGLRRRRMTKWIFRILVLANQDRHQFGKVLFLRREWAAAGIELFEFRDDAVVLFAGFDRTWQCSRQKLAIRGLVDSRYSHFFHPSLLYSACVRNSFT